MTTDNKDARDLLIAELMDALAVAHTSLKRFNTLAANPEEETIEIIQKESEIVLTDSPLEGAIKELQAASISGFVEDMKLTAVRLCFDEFQMRLIARLIDETISPSPSSPIVTLQ